MERTSGSTLTRKTALAALFVALAVALSPYTSLPVGIAKVDPTQHFINVLSAVLLGPLWACGNAAAVGLLRLFLGTGTPLAFPGGMVGALLAGIAFRLTNSIYWAAAGEVFGTGVLGSLLSAYWIAPSFMGKTMSLLPLFASFIASTVAGSIIAVLVLALLKRAGVLPRFAGREPGGRPPDGR